LLERPGRSRFGKESATGILGRALCHPHASWQARRLSRAGADRASRPGQLGISTLQLVQHLIEGQSIVGSKGSGARETQTWIDFADDNPRCLVSWAEGYKRASCDIQSDSHSRIPQKNFLGRRMNGIQEISDRYGSMGSRYLLQRYHQLSSERSQVNVCRERT